MREPSENGSDRRVPARPHVPSQREQRLGATAVDAPATFTIDTGEPAVPTSWRERLRAQRRQLSYRDIASRYGLRPLVVLCAVRVFGVFDDLTLAVIAPQMRRDFGVDLAFLITLGTVLGVVSKLLAPLMGWLVDRVHRVRLLAVGSLVGNLSTTGMGLAGTPAQLAGLRAGGGLAGAAGEPAAYPLLTDWYPQDVRARVFALLGIASSAALVVGPLIGGGVAQLVGWRVAVVGFGVLGVLMSLLLFTLPEPLRGYYDRLAAGADEEAAETPAESMSWGEAWRAASSVVTIRRIWYATPFLTVAGAGMATLMPFYLAEEFGLGPFAIGLIVSAGTVSGMLGLFFGAPIADRVIGEQPAKVMAAFGLVTALGVVPVAVLIVSPWLAPVVIVAIPVGFLSAAIGPALATVLSLVIPARLRGLGMQTMAPWQVLGLLLLPIVGIMGDAWGLRGAFVVLIPVYLLGAVIVGSIASGVGRDIRATNAANLAGEVARRASAEGRTKLVVCRDVDVTYAGTQVLFNVDLDVEAGEMIALVGTNGAGKSTLLRAIAGVQEASNGAIFLDGRDVTHRPTTENARDGVVLVPGGRAIFPSLTVRENLEAALFLEGDRDEDAVSRVLELFPSLRDRLGEAAGDLSGGEQQMVGLAQAFLMKPRLLMIDELSLGLAPAVVQRLLEVVRRINAEGTTVILVEQSINVALTVARRAVFMDKGRIRFDGSTEELLGRADLVRAVFLAGAGSGGVQRRLRRLPDPADGQPVLEVRDLSVSYGGVTAVGDVSLAVGAGEVVGIIGPNGAGKTTLLDAISGFVTPEAGRISIAGVDVTHASPDARAREGLARSFQNARLFGSLTVHDVIAVALETHLKTRSAVAAALWLPQVRRSERRVDRRVDRLIDVFGLEAFANKFVSELSTGSRRIVDLACIMATEPKLLLLDEPSSGLAQAESEALAPVVRRLARDAGCGVVVIEHDIPLVSNLADRIVAMELGEVLLDGEPSDVVNHPRVIQAYLGTDRSVVDRSGPITAALTAAGITAGTAAAEQEPNDG